MCIEQHIDLIVLRAESNLAFRSALSLENSVVAFYKHFAPTALADLKIHHAESHSTPFRRARDL